MIETRIISQGPNLAPRKTRLAACSHPAPITNLGIAHMQMNWLGVGHAPDPIQYQPLGIIQAHLLAHLGTI